MKQKVSRIVIKVGTNILSRADGLLDVAFISRLAERAAEVLAAGHEVVVVSSGAIGAGCGRLGLTERPKALAMKQAVAAVGQVALMERYEEAFGKHRIVIAQVLLSREDLGDRARYLNARNTLNTLLDLNIVPIVNENDTVATDEIQFGDNDTLAALIAAKLEADRLIILTDVDGVFSGDPKKRGCELISRIEKITPAFERSICGESGSAFATGGMKAKIQAAKIALASGVTVHIANGRTPGVVRDILAGKEAGTCFLPGERVLEARKRWIGFSARVKGTLVVDDGARAALTEKHRSLLPSGITGVSGSFAGGDIVSIRTAGGEEIARGMAEFSSAEVSRIRGEKSARVRDLLGRECAAEVVHRNNLVIL